MTKERKKNSNSNEIVWCDTCRDSKPRKITAAEFLIPAREKPYGIFKSGFIDPRVVGVCSKCLKEKNNFQKSNVEPVNINHRYLVRKSI